MIFTGLLSSIILVFLQGLRNYNHYVWDDIKRKKIANIEKALLVYMVLVITVLLIFS